MHSSEARIKANIANAQLSKGPTSESGRQTSRANSYKHGLTGAGVVLPRADAAEVERRTAALADELNATGEAGLILARQAALSSVRMERAADQQTAALTEHVRKVEAEFVPPEGVDQAEADALRHEAARRAMFDPSKEAALARKYEAAAERSFFRCLKELRQRERSAPPKEKPRSKFDTAMEAEMVGSFLQSPHAAGLTDEQLDTLFAEMGVPMPKRPASSPQTTHFDAPFDLPITAARPR